MKRLEDKVAIVIGGGQSPGKGIGNGRATSITFAKNGAKVMVAARHLERASETVDMICDACGEGKSFAYACDITKEQDIKEMYRMCKEKYGKIDIVVNNVGISDDDGSLLTLDPSVFEHIMDTNLMGAMMCIRCAYPYMKERGGSIIQIASISGKMVGNHELFSYAMSKHAMIYLGENAAAIFARDGIRVNNIILGLVHTPLAIESYLKKGMELEKVIELRNRNIPLKGGMGDAWDTANAALFLASDEARFITGANLPVNGGSVVCYGK